MRGKRARRVGRKLVRVAGILAGSIIVLFLAIGIFLALGGTKTALELALPAAMNGYITVGEASYSYFGTADAKNVSMVLDWKGQQETVITAGSVKTGLRLLPLLRRRLEFGTTTVEDAEVNLRILPSGLVNIDRLFRLEGMPPEPFIRVFPPHYTEMKNVRFSFPPFLGKPIQIDRLTAAFYPISYGRVQLIAFAKLAGPVIGVGTIGLYLDIDDEEYIVVYEGSHIGLNLETMEQLPISTSIGLSRMFLPQGRVRISARWAGHGDVVEWVRLSVELDQLNVHSLQYPLSLANATGTVTFDGKTIELTDFRCLVPLAGTNATLQASGLILEDNSVVFDSVLTNVQLTDGIIAFLPGLNEIRDYVSINGECGLTTRMYHKQNWTIPRSWNDFVFRGQITATDYPVPAYDIQAKVRTMPRGAVIVDDLTIEVGSGNTRSVVLANGSFDAVREAAQVFFSSPGVSVNNDLLDRLPQIPAFVCEELLIKGNVPVNGEYVHTSEDDILNAEAKLVDFDILLARAPEVGARGLNAGLRFADNHLAVQELEAEVLSGSLTTDFDMNFSPGNRSFNGDLHLVDLDLSLLPREYVEGLAGIFNADFHFEGTQPTAPALVLQANASMREGRLAQLPLLISVINFLNLQFPGEVVFTSGRVRFNVKDETATIERLELYSDVLNLYAKGWIAFDGRINMRAGLGYQRRLLKEVPVIGHIVRFFLGAIRSALSTVDVTGTVTDPEISLVSVRYLTSPITAVVSFFAEDEEE